MVDFEDYRPVGWARPTLKPSFEKNRWTMPTLQL